jgi:hypothetical protein
MIYTVVLMWCSLCLMVSKELNVHTCKTHENPVINHEWGNDRIVITTNITYLWSFVTRIVITIFCLFSFVHCIVCHSSIYVFWLPLWYLQNVCYVYSVFCCALQTYVSKLSCWTDKSGNNDIHRKPKIEQDEQLLFMSMISKKILWNTYL